MREVEKSWRRVVVNVHDSTVTYMDVGLMYIYVQAFALSQHNQFTSRPSLWTRESRILGRGEEEEWLCTGKSYEYL